MQNLDFATTTSLQVTLDHDNIAQLSILLRKTLQRGSLLLSKGSQIAIVVHLVVLEAM